MTIQTENLYDTDYNLWLEITAQLLRDRKLEQIDFDNLIEEIEDMGNSHKDALESNLRNLLMHLLKWFYQPSKRSNSWRCSIVEHCFRINKSFKKNPSFKRYFDEILEETYQDARKFASVETMMDIDEFPAECPFSKEYILDSENSFSDKSVLENKSL